MKICASFLLTKEPQEVSEKDAVLACAARDFFSSQLAAVFFTLALDPVSNVRLVFAETAVEHQQLCREHPACPDALREILSTAPSIDTDTFAAILSRRVKECSNGLTKEDAKVQDKETEQASVTSSDADEESEGCPEASSRPVGVTEVIPEEKEINGEVFEALIPAEDTTTATFASLSGSPRVALPVESRKGMMHRASLEGSTSKADSDEVSPIGEPSSSSSAITMEDPPPSSKANRDVSRSPHTDTATKPTAAAEDPLPKMHSRDC